MDDKLVEQVGSIVAKNLDKLCSYIYGVGKDVVKERKIECGKAFNEYLLAAAKKMSRVKTILYRDSPVSLYSFYEPLTLRFRKAGVDTTDVNNVLEVGNCILLTGTGGSGKSTLFKHLFLNAIERTDYIPILVELRELNDLNDESTLIDCVYRSLINLKFKLEQQYFIKALESGCFILFFDAFDELEESKRKNVQKQILALCDKYDNNRYVVSSRQLGEYLTFVGWNRFINLSVEKLSKQQALSLIKKLDYNQDIKQKFLTEVENKLYQNYETFASNPLLLTIMLMTFDQYAEIPEKIHLFYQECFQALYSRHDASKGGYKRLVTSKLAYDDFVNVLSFISTLSYLQKEKSFSSDLLVNYINKAKDNLQLNFNTFSYKNDIIEAVCVLIQDGLEYVYAHRSFQEYFTAKYISNLDDEG